eukprot:111625_1
MSGYSSKFRHIYGDSSKKAEQYSDIKNPLCSGESQYVKANARFWAVGKPTGGGPVLIKKLEELGRVKANSGVVATHKGKLTDFDFHPFVDTIIATGADDCKVNVNKFPLEGLTENVTKAAQELKGHRKKISVIQFNPSAANIIASASYDRTCKVWNIENGAQISNFDTFRDNIYSIAWNGDGSMLATTSKDKVIRIFDPRKTEESMKIDGAFGGMKSSKCFWANSFGWVGATGFSKSSKRELKVWDVRNLEKPIFDKGLDNMSSILIPHMDDDLNVLYLAGKGDNSVSYYEARNDSKIMNYLSAYRDGEPQKGGGWVPKRALKVMKCEVQRYLKLTQESLIPISFIVPRKAGGDVFQEDIYPHCLSAKPSQSADEWASGSNAEPNRMNMDPEERKEDDGGADDIVFKSMEQVVAENTELKKRIKELEAEVAQLKGGGDADAADDAE